MIPTNAPLSAVQKDYEANIAKEPNGAKEKFATETITGIVETKHIRNHHSRRRAHSSHHEVYRGWQFDTNDLHRMFFSLRLYLYEF
jgi:hypothetical protein